MFVSARELSLSVLFQLAALAIGSPYFVCGLVWQICTGP